jgi:hypothetical protein
LVSILERKKVSVQLFISFQFVEELIKANGYQWLISVILTTQERDKEDQGSKASPRQIVLETLS